MGPPVAEEIAALPGSKRATLSYSPSRGSGSTRVYGLGPAAASQRAQRTPATGAGRKPPEPLRRAVADSLSSSSTSSLYASGIHGGTSVVASEAARILRDFIANPSTTDLAYGVLVEHALAERDRSPAVVPKCVALLKRYLLRYVPKLQTLRQIDQFCVNIIVECESITSQRGSLYSKSLSQSPGTPSTVSSALAPSSSASSFASISLMKSLHYVRSLVGRHIPKLSFQPVGSMNSSASKQLLPSLSSLLSQSFTSQLSPQAVKARDSHEFKQDTGASSSELSRVECSNTGETSMYISPDLLNWRWPGEGGQQTSSFLKESSPLRSLDVHNHGFLEVGAAALLAGDMVAKIKDQPWKHFITQDLPDIGLLQPSTDTMTSSFASIHGHLKTITASKRMKASPQQVWDNVPISSFYPRARPLFQYRHYSEQQTLKLSFAEIQEVIAEVCSEASIPNAKQLSTTSLMAKRNAQPATDVAISVLIKLVIDMYMVDPGIAAPLTLYMLEGMLSSERSASRARAFDFLLNLGIHAQLLEPMLPEDRPAPEAVESPKETDINNEDSPKTGTQKKFDTPVDKFESWLLAILSEILRLLVQIEEREEIVWASALSCLFYFVCDRGQILKRRLQALDIRVVKTLLEISREYSWAEVVHRNLICMLTNMFYQSSNGDLTSGNQETPMFLTEQVDLLGGIEFICLEYSQANSREEKRNLFLILFDYVLNHINETCLANGVDAYAHDEIEPIVSMLTIAGAPEAFYIAVKHGMEGMGELLKSFVSSALLRSPNYERLYMVLEKVTRKLDIAISSFTRLDSEFAYMLQLTKSYKSYSNIEDGSGEIEKARLSWFTLHSLLHSERSSYRHHGYIWLIQLLVSDINESKNGTIWLNIKRFQEQIMLSGNQETSYLEVPLSISMFCGLLKSKSSVIRWGFLYVLEKFLMLCKLYLHESEQKLTNHKETSDNVVENRIDIANAIIDIMSAALSLVVQNSETDHINILKMCDILFAQLCLRFHSHEVPTVDFRRSNALFHPKSHRHNGEIEGHLSVALDASRKNQQKDELRNASTHVTDESTLISSTASMAAMLLRGYAISPIQLVARTPISLFYWPLIQLAVAATDDIALGVAVGSKGRGNIPGGTSDIRAALLLLLIGKCTEDPDAFVEIEGKEFFRGWLEDTDSRVAYYSAAFLLKRIMTEVPETYQRMLQSLIFKAQQSNNEKLLENPYLQMRGILQLSNDLGAQL